MEVFACEYEVARRGLWYKQYAVSIPALKPLTAATIRIGYGLDLCYGLWCLGLYRKKALPDPQRGDFCLKMS